MSNTFTFNGTNSSQYNIFCSNGGTYDAPERDITVVSIPGRNGDLLIDNGRYLNTTVKFPCFISKNFGENAAEIRQWLCAPVGYCRLEDDAHPDEFRLARYVGGIKFEPRYIDKEAEIELVFDCKPQRFLKSGEVGVNYYTSTFSFSNPAAFPSKPLIRVNGSGAGTLNFNGKHIEISNISSYIMIDFEKQVAYKGTENQTDRLTVVEGFPDLNPGDKGANSGSFSGGITSITIYPRWWTL